MDTYIAKVKALLDDLRKRIHTATAPKSKADAAIEDITSSDRPAFDTK